MDIVLDTNVIIYYLRADPIDNKLSVVMNSTNFHYYISVITETELLAKPDLIEQDQMVIEETLSYFKIVEANSYIARQAALYRKNYRMKLGDAYIAATARYLDIPLWTYNLIDFQKISNLVVTQPQADLSPMS